MKSKFFSVISGVVAAGIVSTIAFAKDHRVLLELEKGKFTAPTEVHNPWMPLKPGMQYIYDGAVVEDGEKIAHRIIFTVTDLTKIINGIETRVIWDRDFSKDKLLESELRFFAQDDDGNVWNLGEHREVYDEIDFVGGRTWLIGHIEGAKAKISYDELKKIAVGAVPGKAIDVQIEKKLGANRYVVEVLSAADGGAEVDVIIDMATHKVLVIEK